MPNSGDVIRDMMALHEELQRFLTSAYNPDPGWLEKVLIICIASRQYVIRRKETGEIEALLIYLKMNEDEIEKIEKLIIPDEVHQGRVLYIAEAANKATDFHINKLVEQMKKQEPDFIGVACHAHNRFRYRRFRR